MGICISRPQVNQQQKVTILGRDPEGYMVATEIINPTKDEVKIAKNQLKELKKLSPRSASQCQPQVFQTLERMNIKDYDWR